MDDSIKKNIDVGLPEDGEHHCDGLVLSGESINHLLLHCELARDLQSSLFNLFGVDCVKSRRVTIVDEQGGQVGCCSILEVLRLAHLCLIWCIWREWKAQSFKDKETSVV
jgi:hypothetical protein